MLRFDIVSSICCRLALSLIAVAAGWTCTPCVVVAQTEASPPPPVAQPSPSTGISAPSAAEPAPQSENQQKRHHLGIGIDAEAFLPSDRKTRSRFGDTWLAAGIGIGNVRTASAHGSVGLDLRVLSQSSDGDRHVFVGLLGAEYRRAFNEDDVDEQREFIPYWGASADVDFVDISSPEDNVHSGVTGTGGGSLLVGTTVWQNEYVNVRYDEIASVRGFNLSGLGITAGVRF